MNALGYSFSDLFFNFRDCVVGAGPAGLSAAYYLATRGYKPTVFEKSARPGGKTI